MRKKVLNKDSLSLSYVVKVNFFICHIHNYDKCEVLTDHETPSECASVTTNSLKTLQMFT